MTEPDQLSAQEDQAFERVATAAQIPGLRWQDKRDKELVCSACARTLQRFHVGGGTEKRDSKFSLADKNVLVDCEVARQPPHGAQPLEMDLASSLLKTPRTIVKSGEDQTGSSKQIC